MSNEDTSRSSRGSRTSDSSSSAVDWSSKNREVVYEQGMRVLDAQKGDVRQLEEKALRTVRVTGLLIGVGATGFRVVQSVNSLEIDGTTAGLGAFFLFLSLCLSVLTYTESSEIVGPTAKYLNKMRDSRHGVDWETDFLVQIPGWVEHNQELVERNALLFTACQTTLVLGVALGAASLVGITVGQTIIVVSVCGAVLLLMYAAISVVVDRDHPKS